MTTPLRPGRSLATGALLFLVLTLASCGREAPEYQPGSIAVDSDPAGAMILLDGQDTGLVTPNTLAGLEPGTYVVSVALDGYLADPAFRTAVVSPLTTAQPGVFNLSATSLTVTSTPAGAAVYIDGEDTGLVTPATVVGVPEGEVEVALVLPGYLVAPASFTATVVAGQANEVPAEAFALRSARTVLCEGFSSVNCDGCGDLAANMHELMGREGFGLDRLLYVKFNAYWPGTDLHYLYNPAENGARITYYQNDLIAGIPMLAMSGAKVFGTSANSSPTADETAAMLPAQWEDQPGYLLDVAADFSDNDVPVEVTFTALDDVALAGQTLIVALVQTLIEYDTAPGSEGETEFHYVFRDRADSVDPLTDLTAGQTLTLTTNLLRGDWDLDTMLVVAYVQDDADKSIAQAGSTALTVAAPARLFLDRVQQDRIIASGGDRP